jgi:hypothetical protein
MALAPNLPIEFQQLSSCQVTMCQLFSFRSQIPHRSQAQKYSSNTPHITETEGQMPHPLGQMPHSLGHSDCNYLSSNLELWVKN